jgi:hypothetical protein
MGVVDQAREVGLCLMHVHNPWRTVRRRWH